MGVLGLSQAFISGVQKASSSPYEVLATQKAAEAIESVFAARDSHTIAWAQMKNAADGGVFLNAATPMKVAGNDGIVNTSDDGGDRVVPVPRARRPDWHAPTTRRSRSMASRERS